MKKSEKPYTPMELVELVAAHDSGMVLWYETFGTPEQLINYKKKLKNAMRKSRKMFSKPVTKK